MFLKADISDIACSDKCHYLFSLDNYVDKENYFADKYITSKTLYVDQWYL